MVSKAKINTIKYKTYLFKNLSTESQEKAIQNNRDINTCYGWDDFILSEAEDKLEKNGFLNPKILYSGFCSQGDGASFECEDVDISRIVKSIKLPPKLEKNINRIFNTNEIYLDISIQIKRINHRYVHENTCKTEVSISNRLIYDSSYIYEVIKELETYIEDLRVQLCKEIYDSIENEYDYLTADESIKDTLTINEHEFQEDGSQPYHNLINYNCEGVIK